MDQQDKCLCDLRLKSRRCRRVQGNDWGIHPSVIERYIIGTRRKIHSINQISDFGHLALRQRRVLVWLLLTTPSVRTRTRNKGPNSIRRGRSRYVVSDKRRQIRRRDRESERLKFVFSALKATLGIQTCLCSDEHGEESIRDYYAMLFGVAIAFRCAPLNV